MSQQQSALEKHYQAMKESQQHVIAIGNHLYATAEIAKKAVAAREAKRKKGKKEV